MKILFIVLSLCASCVPKSELSKTSFNIIPNASMMLNKGDNIIIDIPWSLNNIQEIEEKIFLLPEPQLEEIEKKHWEKAELIVIKKNQNGELSLKPKKKLKEGLLYGIYLRSEFLDKAHLVHVLQAQRSPPVLVKHDLGSGIEPSVPENRIYFSFFFDQPIYVPDGQAIKLSSGTEEIVFKDIIVRAQELRVSLKPNQLRVGQLYTFILDQILNQDGHKADITPISFSVHGKEMPLLALEKPAILLSHDSALISWHLDKEHEAELYFGEEKKSHDCLSGPCPRVLQVKRGQSYDETPSFVNSLYFSKLKPNTSYHFIVRAEDKTGEILLSHGTFKTHSGPLFRFSEIYIDPKIEAGRRENQEEFIELFYAGEITETFNTLKLIFESDKAQKKECVLANAKNPIIINPSTYILVVGKDFDEKRFSIPDNTVMVRLNKKNLCGGLANDRPSIIEIVGENNRLFDRFGAFLWQETQGVSIMRKDVLGEDELSNYCLSKPGAPSPGLNNYKFATCS